MTMLVSPAPWGVPGLEFGNITQAPYRPGYPHQGQDHAWRYADPSGSRRTVAGASGTVITAYNDGGNHLGWGNYVDILIPSTTHRIVLRLAHHETGTVVASRGAQIAAGAPVGRMGNTGKAFGIHLHEGLLINGVWHDPIYYRTHDLPGTPSTAATSTKPFPTAGTESARPTLGADSKENIMYLKATSGTDLVVQGTVYADDGPAGSWRGLTNLEVFLVQALVSRGFATVLDISGTDMAAMMALKGAAEQPRPVTPIPWQEGKQTLSGFGAPTGRIKYPGDATFRGQWHYPPVSNR